MRSLSVELISGSAGASSAFASSSCFLRRFAAASALLLAAWQLRRQGNADTAD